jgi:pantothenate kinase
MTTPIAELVDAARRLASPGRRHILGITGAPAAGKSTLARVLADALAPDAVVVGMDGFHLAQGELDRLGRADRKGAPDTFDGAGYVALLRRLRAAGSDTVYAPAFRRDLEEPIAGAVPVPADVPLVVTEGNYLLLDRGPWRAVRALVDEIWYLDPPEADRIAWLVERHRAFGRTLERVRERTLGSDQANADLIAATKHRADRVITRWNTEGLSCPQ